MRCAASVILYRDLGVANSEAFLEKMERIASEFATVCQRKDAVTIELYDPLKFAVRFCVCSEPPPP